MQFLCSITAAFLLEAKVSIITCVFLETMSVSKYASSSASPLAMRLIESLQSDNAMIDKEVVDNIDQFSDHPSDEEPEGCPVKGGTILTVGKYGKKIETRVPVSQIYASDKDYLQWVRAHITEGKSSAPCMKKLRLYIEMRDVQKSQRIKNQRERPPDLFQRRSNQC